MTSPFHNLNVERELACEFLGVFARYEFALKVTGFAEGDARDVRPAWGCYAKTIAAPFSQLSDPELSVAVDYLLNHPPKKQVLVSGALQWRDAPPEPSRSRLEQVLVMVRRVRNNLFHGGKFLDPQATPGRDQLLVNYSLVVLRACLPLDPKVEAAYDGN